MSKFNNYMIDIETTGVRAGRNSIIQIAGWRFGEEKGQLDVKPFNRCISEQEGRVWDPGTWNWWNKGERAALLREIQSRAEPPDVVAKDFVEWVLECDGQPVLFAKPSHFEFPFIQAFLEDLGRLVPFHYRYVNDMNSIIRGMHYPNDPPLIEMPFHGPAHDAVYDTLNQIEVLWEHLEHGLTVDSVSSEVSA